ncbi:MAG: TIGR00282 family metallophosphoesterase [Clostridia bacterium]|nr:TIGR00282 family metallophosphoesterase [Clostridia bacterium]
MPKLRILAVGDVVGESGTLFIRENLWTLRRDLSLDAVIVNGENSASRGGIDKESAEMILDAGADVITTGNHVWQQRSFHSYLDDTDVILRPANFPDASAGKGYTVTEVKGYKMLTISLLGTVFMESLASPFETAEKILEREKGSYDFAIIDIHAEATSEKIALGLHLDGKVSAVFGTHTHIQTNDARIFEKGTGYVTDVGMTGVFNSVLGIEAELMIKKFLTKIPQYHNTAKGDVTMSGAIFTLDTEGFKCIDVELINFKK